MANRGLVRCIFDVLVYWNCHSSESPTILSITQVSSDCIVVVVAMTVEVEGDHYVPATKGRSVGVNIEGS